MDKEIDALVDEGAEQELGIDQGKLFRLLGSRLQNKRSIRSRFREGVAYCSDPDRLHHSKEYSNSEARPKKDTQKTKNQTFHFAPRRKFASQSRCTLSVQDPSVQQVHPYLELHHKASKNEVGIHLA